MEKKTIWNKLKNALARSRENIVTNFNKIILNKKVIDDEMLESLEEILIQADIGVTATNKLISLIKERAKKGILKDPEEIKNLLFEEICILLEDKNKIVNEEKFLTNKPYVIMVIGVNGVGKTTTIGKLAHYYSQKMQKKVLIAACDTFRAAAIEQLQVWCDRSKCDIIKQKHGSDAASVAFDAVTSGKAKQYDVIIVDTAGRLHTKTNLMEELKKIKRVMKKVMDDAPHETLLVLDANTGQNALKQAQEFNSVIGVDGLILTKLDSTARGGVVIAIKQNLNIPVNFIGIGEQIEDLEKFDSKEFARAILDR